MPTNGRVLVVDDQPLNVEVLEAFLFSSGYEILKAYSGKDAIELANESLPDTVVLDIMMPGMDGYEVTHALKKNPRTSGIPVALLTALDSTEDKVRGLDAGADDFLTKPVNKEELIARVRSLIRLKRLQDRLKASDGPGDAAFKDDPVPDDNVILVLEDDLSACLVYSANLEAAGYRPVVARDGGEAMEVLKKTRPVLIIFDMLLPDVDGLVLLSKIKGDPRTAGIPVLIISSLDDLQTKINGIDTGADDYLVKPVDQLELLARVRATLRKYAISQVLKSRLESAMSQSLTDALTGLYNRRYLMAVIEKEMAASKRYHRPLSIAVFDIDHFKRINDTYGHLSGDSVLSELGRLVKGKVRACDIAVRYGGEEFVVLLPDTGLDDAWHAADKLRAAIEVHEFKCVGDSKVTVSIGVTEFRPDEGAEDVIKRADEGLYTAKSAGRNRVVKNR